MNTAQLVFLEKLCILNLLKPLNFQTICIFMFLKYFLLWIYSALKNC